jgi:DNA-directed RNA polymerase subunit L
MPETKTPLIKISENQKYKAEGETYIITEDHSLADVVRWCIEQSDKEEVKYLVEKE